MNIAETLAWGTSALNARCDSPRLDAEILLGKVLGLSRGALIAQDQRIVTEDATRGYERLIAERSAGTPVAYLTGAREFWSLKLRVSPAVLVPRPETEVLVEQALALRTGEEVCAVLDLGTGSGAIAIAIASERSSWTVTGVDISADALDVARGNAQALGVQVDWRLGSWFDAVPNHRFDLILGNPPYVGNDDAALAALSAEPLLALTPGPTGLEAFSAIIAAAPAHLKRDGWLLLEHGPDQSKPVAGLMARHGMTDIRTIADLAGKPRVTLAILHHQQ